MDIIEIFIDHNFNELEIDQAEAIILDAWDAFDMTEV